MKKNTFQTNKLFIPVLSDSHGFYKYIKSVKLLPLLSKEEEKELTEDFHYRNNIASAQRLIMSHLRFVVKVALTFKGYGIPITDLIQEGNIGLMKAVKRFDPNVGVRLVSFAVHWIKAEMHEYVLKNWKVVKIATTKSQRKLFFNLRSHKKHLEYFSASEVEEISKALNVKPKTLIEMEKRMSSSNLAIDSFDNSEKCYESYFQDNRSNIGNQIEEEQFKDVMMKKIKNMIDALDLRSQEIILSRWFSENKTTLQDLAKRYDISAERVRQLEKIAIEKLKLSTLNF